MPSEATAAPTVARAPEEALARAFAFALAPVSLGLGVLFLVFAFGHYLVLAAELRRVLLPMALLSALPCLLLWRFAAGGRIPLAHAQAAGFLLAMLVLANSLTHLYLSADPVQTTNLMLLAIGIGSFFLDYRWIVFGYLSIGAGWLAIALLSPANAHWPHFGFALVTAMLIGVLIVVFRRNALLRLQAVSQRERAQRADLAAALAKAQSAEDDLLRLNRELLRAKEVADASSRARSQFLANMSHELRTPMNAVMALSELLLGKATDPTQQRQLALINDSARQQLDLIVNVLDIAELESGRVRSEQGIIDLPGLLADIERAIGPRCAARKLTFRVAMDPELPARLQGDEQRLRQVLLHLLSNAVKFTHAGGVELLIEPAGSAGDIVLRVRDTGIGIEPGQRRHIFDTFMQGDVSDTRRYGGTGLGLALAAQLVGLMGGTIECESEPGRGSTFSVTLHLDPPAAAPRPAGGT